MSWEGITAIVALIGLILTIMGNVGVFAFFAGKIVAKLDSWTQLFERFEKSYEIHQTDYKTQRTAMWDKIDEHSEKISYISARIKNVEDK